MPWPDDSSPGPKGEFACTKSSLPAVDPPRAAVGYALTLVQQHTPARGDENGLLRPGAKLLCRDVGRPILTLRTMASKIKLALGQWHLVSGHQFTGAGGGEGDFLLVLLRVQNVKDLSVPLPEAAQ